MPWDLRVDLGNIVYHCSVNDGDMCIKEISLAKVHSMARAMPYSEFEQHIKSWLMDRPMTVELDCEMVMLVTAKSNG